MPGIIQDNLLFPILDLIRSEIQKNNNAQADVMVAGDPFGGTPSVTMYREHPLDPEVVTGATLKYNDSGYSQEIFLYFGLDSVDISPDDPNYDYVRSWILRSVRINSISNEGKLIQSVHISLNYDSNWRLTGTTVARIDQ